MPAERIYTAAVCRRGLRFWSTSQAPPARLQPGRPKALHEMLDGRRALGQPDRRAVRRRPSPGAPANTLLPHLIASKIALYLPPRRRNAHRRLRRSRLPKPARSGTGQRARWPACSPTPPASPPLYTGQARADLLPGTLRPAWCRSQPLHPHRRQPRIRHRRRQTPGAMATIPDPDRRHPTPADVPSIPPPPAGRIESWRI